MGELSSTARPRLKILLVEDEAAIARTLSASLVKVGHHVEQIADGGQAMERLSSEVFDLVITDIRLPNVDGLTIFAHLRQSAPSTQVILMSAYGTIAEAVRVMKEKAAYYLSKPFDLHQMIDLVENIANERNHHAQLEEEASSGDRRVEIIGDSPGIALIRKSIAVIAKSDAPVLITGESGSGKELVARAIHARSPRAGAELVTLNCATLQDTSIEPPDRGTVFLDEVAELSLAAQGKLLRAIETGRYELHGVNTTRSVDVRIISASNVDLQARVEERRFRADLYYRLKVLHVRVPPLRERRSDVPLLLHHFYERAIGAPAPSVPLSASAWATLNQYQFPGNARELKHAIEHAVVLAEGKQINLEHLPEEISGHPSALGTWTETTPTLPEAIREFERDYLVRVLASAEGQRSRAAEILGISRKTLWAKLRQYGISDQER